MKQLADLFFAKRYSIKRATALLAITALLSNALGLLRNLAFYRFVPAEQLDVYFASFRIPDLVFNLLILGAISSAFIPILSSTISRGLEERREVWRVADQVFSWITITFVVVCTLLALAMPPLMSTVVDGFDQARKDSTILLSRILLLQSTFMAWSFIFGGLLNSFKRFSSYALAPLLYNISLIIGGFFAREYGITAIAISAVVGAILHCTIQFRESLQLGYRPRWNLQWSKEVREILTLMVPRSLSQGMAQLVLLVYTYLGSHLVQGSIAVFSGMNDLQTTPTMIIGNSLAVAFFPTIAGHVAKKDWEGMNTLLTKAIRAALFLLLPSIAVSLVLRAQIVRLYIGIGGAGWGLTELAIDSFVIFLLGVVPASLVALLARTFYAFKDTRTPLILSSLAGLAGIATSVIGIQVFNGTVVTLATAVTVVAWSQFILYLALLYRREHVRLNLREISRYALSYLLGSLTAALATWLTLNLVHEWYELTNLTSTRQILGLFLQMTVGGIAGTVTYILYSHTTHQEEIRWIKSNLFTRES